ncbi:MAG: hypothetical protein ABSF03_31490 [Streptosporangiaceae bacterium]
MNHPSPGVDEGNDGRFADDSLMEVRYPLSGQEERGNSGGGPLEVPDDQ